MLAGTIATDQRARRAPSLRRGRDRRPAFRGPVLDFGQARWLVVQLGSARGRLADAQAKLRELPRALQGHEGLHGVDKSVRGLLFGRREFIKDDDTPGLQSAPAHLRTSVWALARWISLVVFATVDP